MTMEFRHPSWFDDEVLELLRNYQTTLCIADARTIWRFRLLRQRTGAI